MRSRFKPTSRRAAFAVLTLLAVVALGYLVAHEYRAVRQRYAAVESYAMLQANLAAIQLSIERFAVDSDGSYPHDLQELLDGGYVTEWPENPFRPGEPMRPLRPGDPWEPGGFVYVGWGPVIAIGGQTGGAPTTLWQDTEGTEIPSDQRRLPTPTEIDEYLLAAYAPRGGRTLTPESLWFHDEGLRAWRGRGLAGLSWEHIAFVARSGMDVRDVRSPRTGDVY